jgi:acyl dehydratase
VKPIERHEISDYIGFVTEPSEWFEVTQDQINEFAECTLDRQFIHVNPELAAQTPFGTTVAHGFLTLSMISYFSISFNLTMKGIYMGVNKGLDRARFVAPVKVGSYIRGQGKVLSIEEKKSGQFEFKLEVTIEIKGEEKPALVAEWLTVQMVA